MSIEFDNLSMVIPLVDGQQYPIFPPLILSVTIIHVGTEAGFSLGTSEEISKDLKYQAKNRILPPKTRETTTKIIIDETIRLMKMYVAELIFPNVFGCEECQIERNHQKWN